MGRMIGALVAVAIGAGAADSFAAPPTAGSEQESLLAPHGAWVKGLTNPYLNQACCDLSDCRAVSARVRNGRYQAFIGRREYGDEAPDTWLDVPEEVILREQRNPVGQPIACWKASRQPLYNGFFCFTDANAS